MFTFAWACQTFYTLFPSCEQQFFFFPSCTFSTGFDICCCVLCNIMILVVEHFSDQIPIAQTDYCLSLHVSGRIRVYLSQFLSPSECVVVNISLKLQTSSSKDNCGDHVQGRSDFSFCSVAQSGILLPRLSMFISCTFTRVS